MPLHAEIKTKFDFLTKQIFVGDVLLPKCNGSSDFLKGQSIGVEKFGSLLQPKLEEAGDLVVYTVASVTTSNEENFIKSQVTIDQQLTKLFEEVSSLLRDDTASKLLPKLDFSHKLELGKTSCPPHGAIFQPWPGEFMATKEYISKVLRRKKIRPNRSLYGAALFYFETERKTAKCY